MKTKHTPGPWLVEHDKEFDEVTVYAEIEEYEYNMTICEVSSYITKDGAPVGLMDTEQIADNARLIAAAPEMYEALRDIVEQAEKTMLPIPADLADSIRVFGKAALEKVEGKQ